MISTKSYLLLLVCVMFQFVSGGIVAEGEQGGIHVIKSKDIAISVSDKGEITAVNFAFKKAAYALGGLTKLENCVVKDVKSNKLADGGMKFTKTLFHEAGKRTVTLVEQFVPTATSIRWEIEMKCSGKPWSTPVETELKWPAAVTSRFWTSWMHGNKTWEDPLIARPWQDITRPYGPHFGSGFCIPLARRHPWHDANDNKRRNHTVQKRQ